MLSCLDLKVHSLSCQNIQEEFPRDIKTKQGHPVYTYRNSYAPEKRWLSIVVFLILKLEVDFFQNKGVTLKSISILVLLQFILLFEVNMHMYNHTCKMS